MAIKASELTFGVEIEACIPTRGLQFDVGGYHSGIEICVNDERFTPLNGWQTQHDGSIAPRNGFRDCEFVSPILQGTTGLKRLWDSVNVIKTICRAKVNTSCGVHVHVGFPVDADALKRLVHLVASHEQGLFAAAGTPRREHGRYCRGIKQEYSKDIQFTESRWDGMRCNERGVTDRYKMLNLANMLNGTRKTVEFRLFSGSVRPEKILAWVRLCLALCERAINGKRAVKWESQDRAVVHKTAKTGPGFASVKLMMYKLGWVKGRSFETDPETGKRVHKTWGDSVDIIDGLPPLKDSRKVLKGLALKYDEKLATNTF